MSSTNNVSYQQWHLSQTYPVWDIPLVTDEGPDDITGIPTNDIKLYFRNTTVTPPVDTVGTGTITVLNTNPAEIYYKPSTTDVASIFTGEIVIKVNFPSALDATTLAVYDGIPFVISY